MAETIFDLPYKILTFLGLWAPSGKNSKLRHLYAVYQSWTFLYLFAFTAFLFFDLYHVRYDIHRSSTNLSATITILIILWKDTIGLLNFRHLRRLQARLNSGLRPKEDARDVLIMRRAARDIRLTCWSVYLLGVSAMTAWIVSGFLITERTKEHNLPLPVYVPWNHHETPFYELSVAFQIYGSYLCTFDALSYNLSIFGTIAQICSEYDVLLKNTGRLSEWYEALEGGRGKARALSEDENREAKQMLVDNIKHHQKIIECAGQAENCYTHIMLVQVIGATILLTFVALDLILVTREVNSRFIPLLMFLVLAISDIYLFCYFGARLIQKNHELQCWLYETPWEAMDSKNRKIVLVMIMRTSKPPKITIEKFASIDFYNLLGLTKIVYNTLYLLLHVAKVK